MTIFREGDVDEAVQTILEAAAAKAAPLVGAQVAKWTDMLVDATRAKLLPLVPASVQGLVAAGLEAVKRHEDALTDTSAQGFLAIVTHLAAGREDAARTVWLGQAADFEARQEALDEASEATRAEREKRDARWGTAKAAGVAFLEGAGKMAFPILLGFVPL